MCSVNDGGGDIEDLSGTVRLLSLKVSKVLPKKCNKCKEEKPCVILRNKDAYCRACFLNNTVHKFKALLGKHRLIKDNDRVLVYHQGGHPTTALLNFIRTGLDLDTPKKLRFVPICLFIEQHYAFPQYERLHILKKVASELKIFNIPIYFTSLTNYYGNGSSDNIFLTEDLEELKIDGKDSEKMKSVFNTSESLENDLKKIYERKLLIDAAEKLNCRFIFTPELSTDIASRLLSNVALGRGSHIPLDTGFCDARHNNVTILRPLRVFDIKELALYNYFSNLNPLVVPQQPKNPYKCVQNLIEKFVNELQSNYPATVTTVLKTGDKLSMQNAKIEDTRICYICQGPIQTQSHHLSTEKSVLFSHQISTNSNQLIDDLIEINTDKEMNGRTCFSCSKIESFLILEE